jgi:hypothetical protein
MNYFPYPKLLQTIIPRNNTPLFPFRQGTMEVFQMQNEGISEIKRAIAHCNGFQHNRSIAIRHNKDKVTTLCTVCKKTLSEYENLKHPAYCFECNKNIYRETRKESPEMGFNHPFYRKPSKVITIQIQLKHFRK